MGAQYWQLSEASDAAYQRGPKAQEMLNRNIASCVAEVKELERLGMIREAIPADNQGRVLSSSQQAYARFDTPEKFGALNLEHNDYQDFEGCMLAKGWERVKYVPYDVAHTARTNYLKAIDAYGYYSRIGHRDNNRTQDDDPVYGDLNN